MAGQSLLVGELLAARGAREGRLVQIVENRVLLQAIFCREAFAAGGTHDWLPVRGGVVVRFDMLSERARLFERRRAEVTLDGAFRRVGQQVLLQLPTGSGAVVAQVTGVGAHVVVQFEVGAEFGAEFERLVATVAEERFRGGVAGEVDGEVGGGAELGVADGTGVLPARPDVGEGGGVGF